MMSRFAFGLAMMCLAAVVLAQEPGQRQYYGPWIKHSTKNYYYRNLNFKKSANDEKYTYHYAIYFPSRGKLIYMYNPSTRKYWGAWDGDKYSLLPKDKQKASIDDIAVEDFPPFGVAPTIPGVVGDMIVMIPPPKNFPKAND